MKTKPMKSILTAIATLVAVFTLTACNTVQGVGKDIQKAGEVIEKSSEKK
ncbi:MAG: entericidin A/B family lipoprotein [Limnobacter sp.]|nr:entericidin A/B family lipoprotein [Limnobacter sp.]